VRCVGGADACGIHCGHSWSAVVRMHLRATLAIFAQTDGDISQRVSYAGTECNVKSINSNICS
jgi:hypothetical protein